MNLRKLSGGVVLGWIATVLSIAIGLYMSPFLIRHLGVTGYGVWVLVQGTVSYMYLMDLGLRTTVVRFTARAQGRGDYDEVNKVVSAALWVRIWTAAAVMTIAVMVAAAMPHIFRLSLQYQTTARIALLLMATVVSSTLIFSVFTAVLSGAGHFDLLALLEIGQMSVVALGLVPILRTGHGIVAMAVWQLTVVVLFNMLLAVSCHRVCPQLRLSIRVPDRELMRSLWSVGFYVLIGNCAGQLILYSDNLVVGMFVAVAAVSYYSIAGKMVEYVRQIAISVLKMFMPLASSFAGDDQYERLRQLHVRGSQFVLLVTYPLVIVLLTRGGTVLRLWLGDSFSANATRILQVLSVGIAIMLANATVSGIALALDKQRLMAGVAAIEGVANLTLSVILARRMGALGVAIGTVIPAIGSSLIFWPLYLCPQLKLPTWRYIREGWLRPVLAAMPFLAVSIWAEAHWVPKKLIWFVLQSAVLMPVALAGALLVFYKDVPRALNLLKKRRSPVAAGRTV